MHVHVVLRYEAGVDRVAAMLADATFVTGVIETSGGRPELVDVTGDATGAGAFTVTTRRAMPTDQIPAQLRSFVGTELQVRQATAWGAQEDGLRRGSVAVEIAGTPVRLTGTTRLSAGTSDTGAPLTTVEYDGEVRAAVPLFGSAIEQAAGGAIRSALAAEESVGRRWLTGTSD